MCGNFDRPFCTRISFTCSEINPFSPSSSRGIIIYPVLCLPCNGSYCSVLILLTDLSSSSLSFASDCSISAIYTWEDWSALRALEAWSLVGLTAVRSLVIFCSISRNSFRSRCSFCFSTFVSSSRFFLLSSISVFDNNVALQSTKACVLLLHSTFRWVIVSRPHSFALP